MKNAFFHRLASRSWLMLAAAAGLSLIAGAAAVQGAPRTSIHPYLEVQQVAHHRPRHGGDVLTYTGVGGGVDAAVATRRVQATISVNYQRRVGWNDRLDDHDVDTGLAAAHVDGGPGRAQLRCRRHGGAHPCATSASRFRTARTIDSADVAEVYSAYAGPDPLDPRRAGRGRRQLSARLCQGRRPQPRRHRPAAGPAAGRPLFEHSTVHNATVSVGMEPGELPFGWTVGAGYVREDTSRLDIEFEGKYVRGDVVVPVSPHPRRHRRRRLRKIAGLAAGFPARPRRRCRC